MVYILAKIVTKHIKQELIFDLRRFRVSFNASGAARPLLRQIWKNGSVSLNRWRQKRASFYSMNEFSKLADNLT